MAIFSYSEGSVKSFVSSRNSLPDTLGYEDLDAEAIKRELTLLGYNPGPITITTKRVYLKKLQQLKKLPKVVNPVDKSVVSRGRFYFD